MGCGASKPKSIKPDKGFFVEKITSTRNTMVTVLDKVYLFGGARILEFDTKAMRITQLPADPALRIPRLTQSEYVTTQKKIATLGGMLDGQFTDVGYLFNPPDFHNYQRLPPYPKPIRNTTLTVIGDELYAIGGETIGPDPECILSDVYKLSIRGGQVAPQWEKVCDLAMPRRSALVAVTQGTIFVFGGYNGKGLRTTQIETIDINTKQIKVQPYRLPLGVEGARLCWHGDDILMIGGRRIGDKPDGNVLLLDLEKKAAISMRDLISPRDFPLVIPTGLDEVVVIGGGGLKTCEKRSWNDDLMDYEFKPCSVEGAELIDDPSNYDTALPSFVNTHADHDVFPDINPEHKIIFGNEIDCFLVEFPHSLVPYFYPSPLRLQQKTGQVSIRSDPNTIYLVGGTDCSRSKISSKCYKMFIRSKEIIELAKLNHPRYFPTFVHVGTDFYVIGGKGKGGVATPTMERLSQATETQKWDECAPMKQARFGHVSWTTNRKIYVMGGTTHDDGKPIETVEVYDTTTNSWSVSNFRMNPALNGASLHQTDHHVYLFGGQDSNDMPTTAIYKIDANNPTAMERFSSSMRIARVDCFVFRLADKVIVLGGSDQPLMECFEGPNLTAVAGIEHKSESFFHQLSNYTSDLKLENCSWG